MIVHQLEELLSGLEAREHLLFRDSRFVARYPDPLLVAWACAAADAQAAYDHWRRQPSHGGYAAYRAAADRADAAQEALAARRGTTPDPIRRRDVELAQRALASRATA